MKKIFLSVLTLIMMASSARADEGMWLLPFLKKLNIDDMKAKGLKLEAEDIYSVNNTSLKDAIAIFGGGCTSELISPQGLLLTNHHCGYGSIQQHSSVQNDYLKDGFWAMSFAEEIPTPGLSATFVKEITDVTEQINAKLGTYANESERNSKISQIISQITAENKPNKEGHYVIIKSFFGGNQYIMFEMIRYDDVRMVGAPPSSIGKFGGDTDNWMWPRHTGDFSLFRIYTDKDGNPASYSPNNVPMESKKYLPISIKGVKEGDFTMVLGFPGSTNRYMTSYEVNETLTTNNPVRIKVRGIRQDVLMEDMKADREINIKYANKYASSSNYWKNSIGMNEGIVKLDVEGDKAAIETRFLEWIEADEARKNEYGKALPLIEEAVKNRMPINYVLSYIRESLWTGIELVSLANSYLELATELDKKERGLDNKANAIINSKKSSINAFYKDYSPSTDRKSAKAMFKLFMEDVTAINRPTYFAQVEQMGAENAVDYMYDNTIFANEETLTAFLNNPSAEVLANDPILTLTRSINEVLKALTSSVSKYNTMAAEGHRLFVKGYTEMDKDVKTFYPDANFTMRMTYGNVLPYMDYDYTTTLSGVIKKEDLNNPYEFTVEPKLKELYKKKDFGNYGKKDVTVGFISNNDITGGNSGSPVINGKGELVGLAFDGNWEAMSGDIAFEPDLQRCISVDIRYVLFIIDKYAGATRLIDEMTIIK
ncbi:MAG: S46 family peptidase [Rikenellaceae bacterium]